MSKLFPVITFVSAGLLFLNSVLYPGFSDKYTGLSSLAIFSLFSFACLTSLLIGKSIVPNNWIKLNKYFFFPGLLVTSSILILLEKTHYDNYILQHLHIFPFSFVYLMLFSTMIFVVSLLRNRNKKELIDYVIFLAIFIVFYYLWIEHHYLFLSLVEEDSILEYLQFIFYFLTAVIAFKIFLQLKIGRRKLSAVIFFLFSLALFFVAFEEISWGQRILGFKTPENIKEINVQRELNLHNLFSYDLNRKVYIIVGIYGIFSRLIVVKLLSKKNKNNLLIFTPPFSLVPYFLFLFVVYYDMVFVRFYYDTIVNNVFRRYAVWQWLEVSELYLSVAFYLFALSETREFSKRGETRLTD